MKTELCENCLVAETCGHKNCIHYDKTNTFEGTMTIKFYKHDRGEVRGITIDAPSKKVLGRKLKIIKNIFMTKIDPENPHKNLPYNIHFELHKRP